MAGLYETFNFDCCIFDKSNFKSSTVIWIISAVLMIFLGVDILLVRGFAESGNIIAALIYPLLLVLVFVFMCNFSVFSYTARFDDGIKAYI